MTTSQEMEARMMRGQAIAQVESNVRRIDAHEYRVRSQSGDWEYTVLSTEAGWTCSCPDFIYHEQKCKHIFAVELSLLLRRRIENAKRIVPLDYQSCLECSSERIVKDGILHNKSGDIQRFVCQQCGKRFTRNLGFENMRAKPEAITLAMQLYFSGESLRNVQKALALQGVKVSHVAILKWIRKYVGLMNGYLSQIQPNVSDTWRTDELFIKVKGDMKYLFAMMDDETRFRISQMVADHKGTSDVRPMFHDAQEVAGKKPRVLVSDGAQNFHEAFTKEYRTNRADSPVHERHIHLEGDMNNNKMERQNGEVRDREKTMRSLKKDDSPVINGIQIYHNYFRPHMGLDGRTPAEAAGIKIEGENPWITVIQNAVHVHRLNRENHVP